MYICMYHLRVSFQMTSMYSEYLAKVGVTKISNISPLRITTFNCQPWLVTLSSLSHPLKHHSATSIFKIGLTP